MDSTQETKAYIDRLTYDQLLERWRFTPAGDPWMMGATGAYWRERMAELERQGVDRVAASKRIGFSFTRRICQKMGG